jgi:hypothetical protein
MADSKITALTALTAADPANDMMPIVDVSDTSMAASGTTKRISINNILACSPSATLASATITGDLTVDTSTLKVDSTNNRVGIGTASPAYPLSVAGRISYSSGIGEGADLTVSSSGTVLQYGLGSSWTQQLFYLAGAEAMRLNSTGLGVGVTPAGTGGCLQLKSGITFPATQVASSDANTLDDYEEGTWTPALTFATPGTLALTYNLQSGIYTKIGRLVTVIFKVSFAAAGIIKGTASGNLSITGLPFTVGSVNVYQYVDLGSSITDITTGSFALITASGTSIAFETVSTSGTRIQRDSAALTAASFAASNASFITISGTFTYTV